MTPGLSSTPSMTAPEAAALGKYLTQSRVYLEYGCGGSTLLAEELGVRKLYSVESDRTWADAVRTHPKIATRVAAGDYLIHHADIGEVGPWGRPLDRSREGDWHHYYQAIWQMIDQSPDFVLVDGRFRVACTLEAFAQCGTRTVVAIHDFDREPFHVVLKHAEPVERVDNLIFLRRNRLLVPEVFLSDLANHMHVPD